MPARPLFDEDARLEQQLSETIRAGIGENVSIPDLQYGVRALIQMFDIKRRPIAAKLRYCCDCCNGLKKFTTLVDKNHINEQRCPECDGKGYKE